MANDIIIQTEQLTKRFGDFMAVDHISFDVHKGEIFGFLGANGAGKTTLVNAVMAKVRAQASKAQVFAGTIATEKELNLGLYEQEIDPKYLPMKLRDAIERSYIEHDVQVNDQKVKQLLGDYLFNPSTDGDVPIERLSGGQKARFQLIRMLISDPIILILDEPTNHLDLPSIEELENALADYHGAVIYISHDTYFARKLGGETLQIGG